MERKKTYIERMLESNRKVTTVAEKTLTFAEEIGLTMEETEEVPGEIESILKKERYKGDKKYRRPHRINSAGSED